MKRESKAKNILPGRGVCRLQPHPTKPLSMAAYAPSKLESRGSIEA